MIKKLLTVASVVLTVASIAQTGKSTGTKSIALGHVNTSSAKTTSAGCIQLSTQTSNTVEFSYTGTCSSLTPNAFGGYIVGTNCYGDLEKANFFAPSLYTGVTSPSISAVQVSFYKDATNAKGGTQGTGTVTLNIYNGSAAAGPSGAAIASVTASIVQIIASQSSPPFADYTFTLTSSIVAPAAGFFAACTIPTTAGDTVVIFDGSNATSNTAWERTSGGTWNDMSSQTTGWQSPFNLSIYPIVCGSNITTGISKSLGLSKDVTIMPNPSTGLVNVAIALAETENISVTVINALGQQILSNKYDGISNQTVSLDLTNQSNGVYFVTVSNGKDKMVQRLILNK